MIRKPGYFDVIAHGNSESIRAISAVGKPHEGVSPSLLSRYLQRHPAYSGQNIRLISCETGKFTDGFAAQLAREAGVNVMAPNESIFIFGNGDYIIAPEINYPFSVKPFPDTTNPGFWQIFTP